MRLVALPQRGQKPLVDSHQRACMAMPPSDSSGSGKRAPRIGIIVSRARPGGGAVSAATGTTQHGSSR